MTREEKAIEGILIISSALSEEGRKKLTANLVGQLSEQDRKELLEKLAGEKSTPINTPRETYPDTPDPLENRK